MKRSASPTADANAAKQQSLDIHTGPVDADTQLIYFMVIVCEHSGHLITAAVNRDQIPAKYLPFFAIATDPPNLPITELNRVPNENPLDMANKFCLYALFAPTKRMNPVTKRMEADPNINMEILERKGLGKDDVGAMLKFNLLSARSKVECVGLGESLLSSSLLFVRRNTTINEVRFTFFDSWRDELAPEESEDEESEEFAGKKDDEEPEESSEPAD